MIIDFVDSSMGDAEEGELGAIREQGRRAVTINRSEANSINLVIDAIIARAEAGGGRGVITLLRFFGHGARGGMGITNSEHDLRTMPQYSNVISRSVIAANPHIFARLRPYFAAKACVELHGCHVARGPEGRQLLRWLSDIWGVPVSAGSHTQSVGSGDVLTQFESTVYTAYPNGRLTRDPNRRVQK